jgi:ADP-ribose pyrophosphatase YjhB (NUDIX family)
MIEQTVTHHIQKFIVSTLIHRKYARFRDLRPPRADTNLFSYHLKSLIKNGFVDKTEKGYTLSSKGLAYVDGVSGNTVTVRHQPRIITMLLVQNSEGRVLLQKRTKQPYIDAWTLPYGKMHIGDKSILKAAEREAFEKLLLKDQIIRHVGDCYIRVHVDNTILSTTLAHICRFETDDIIPDDTKIWVKPLSLSEYDLAPAVEQIITRSFFGDDHFFAEFDHQWSADEAPRR